MDNKHSAIILAAGKGTRLDPLTRSQPKALIPIVDKTIIEHTLIGLKPYIDEAIIIVHTFHEQIESYLGNNFQGVRLVYVYQEEPLGTGHAVQAAAQYVNHEKTFIVYGDDLYDTHFYEQLSSRQNAAIAVDVPNWQNYGIFQLKNGIYLDSLIEKPKEHIGNLANPGVYFLSRKIFDYFEQISQTERGELEFTDMVTLMAKDEDIEVVTGEGYWIPIGYPWDILRATQFLLKKQTANIVGKVDPEARIGGNISIGTNSFVKSGAVIDGDFWIGKNVVIESEARLLGYGVIDNDSIVSQGALVSESIVGRSCQIGSHATIANSILGKQIEIGSEVAFDNSVTENQEVFVLINGKATPTGGKFGSLIGDLSHIATGAHLTAGRKIPPHTHIAPGITVSVDPEI